MISGSNFRTRRILETQTPNNSRQLIRELSWLKPHHIPFISIFKLFKKSFVERSKLSPIHIMWDNFIKSVHQSFPRYQWLIKWIKASNILVTWKSFAYMIPEGNIFVLDTKVIEPKSSKKGECLRRCVVYEERILLAIFDQRLTFTVVSKSIGINRFAASEMSYEWAQNFISHCWEAVCSAFDDFCSIKVWHALTTNLSG